MNVRFLHEDQCPVCTSIRAGGGFDLLRDVVRDVPDLRWVDREITTERENPAMRSDSFSMKKHLRGKTPEIVRLTGSNETPQLVCDTPTQHESTHPADVTFSRVSVENHEERFRQHPVETANGMLRFVMRCYLKLVLGVTTKMTEVYMQEAENPGDPRLLPDQYTDDFQHDEWVTAFKNARRRSRYA
ncbi:hypothetical protein [Haloglomus salinum]|uniref:hypothetical protein n=1 Tax=Haloglomus salinum TaxID=2962673 RepID=UPI0020C9FF5B|nr:hypothetical protein [Haloglomus salinum]